jgi:hypothetical protein
MTERSTNYVSIIVFQEQGPNPFEDALPDFGIMALWMTLMPYSLLVLTGGFISFPLLERVSKAKQLQLMTGASPMAYWFTCFICDFLYYITVASIMVLGILAADPLDAFNGSEELGMYVCMYKYVNAITSPIYVGTIMMCEGETG